VPDARTPRILQVTQRSDFTGGRLYVLRLLRGLGDAVTCPVACPADGPVARDCAALVPERSLSPAAVLRLSAFVRRNGIDVVHSHGKGAGV
jgi:hypothetical protein